MGFPKKPVDFKPDERVALKPMTFWVPADLKEKYDRLQGISRREFGRALKASLVEALAEVDEGNSNG